MLASNSTRRPYIVFHWSILACVAVLLSSCGLISPVVEPKDSAPLRPVDPRILVDAIPREDAITRAGNKNPYTVLGKTYHLLPSSDGYRATGKASWYGTKFHGRNTANGELYSLYGMTAAHRSLPIPAYVKVTNLQNNRTAIVRVNDRGPFHSERIIDLSYAAAVKLGFAEQGTAEVLIETIKPRQLPVEEEQQELQEQASNERYFLQVGAFKSLALANTLRADLLQKTPHDVSVKASEPAGFYRVQLGPLTSISQVQQVSEQLISMNLEQPRVVTE
jgi:rare lipoprotein A